MHYGIAHKKWKHSAEAAIYFGIYEDVDFLDKRRTYVAV